MKAKHCHVFSDAPEAPSAATPKRRTGIPARLKPAPVIAGQWPASVVRHAWISLNIARRTRNLHSLSLSDLAVIAGNSNAIAGSSNDTHGGHNNLISKSTVAAVLKGAYNASTEPAIRARLHHCIMAKFGELGIDPPDPRDPNNLPDSEGFDPCEEIDPYDPTHIPDLESTTIKSVKSLRTEIRKPRTPRVIITRCDQAGYLTHNKRTYYLGTDYAGRLCTVTSMRDRKDKGIRFTTTIKNLELTATITGTAYPIDPTTSQLGYKAPK